MRYFLMILAAGLLSAGLFAASGPAHSAMPTLALDRSAVADMLLEKAGYYYRRRYYSHTLMAIDLIDPITAMAIDGPIMVMDMGVAGATENRPCPVHGSLVRE